MSRLVDFSQPSTLFSNSMKISFILHGFKKIEKIVLHKNGVFGHYLFHENLLT